MRQLFNTIRRYRLSSVLTLLSLTIAFLGIIVLTLYVDYETSFDGFHKNKKDIYLLSFRYDMGSSLPVPLEELIRSEMPEVEKSVVMWPYWNNQLMKPGQSPKDAITVEMASVSEDFFTVFDFPLVSGSPETVLTLSNSLVLSEATAMAIFGSTDVLGKQLVTPGGSYTVTGLMKDMPENTSFRYDALVSLITREHTDWSEWSYSIFLQLKNGADKVATEQKLSGIGKISELLEGIKELYSEEAAKIELRPLSTLHYGSNGYMFPSVNRSVLDILLLLVVVLLIMGAVNFINFSTSQAPLRARALSIRQILGADRWSASLQITGEALILSLLALLISLIIHRLSFRSLENLFQISGLSFQGREYFYLLFLLSAILFGFVAAFYPSRYITSTPISQAVKGKLFFSGKGKRFRSILIVIQFVFSIALITSSLTIEKQLRFWNNFNIGIDKENVLYLPVSGALQQSYRAFADELMKNPDIIDYCYTQFLPGTVGMGWGRTVDGQQVQLMAWPVDDRFIRFFGIEITEGRGFREGDSDINNFILNQKAVNNFGWDNALERKFPGFDFQGDIVGISRNFNFASLKDEIEPMLFWRTETRKNYILIKTTGHNFTQLRSYIENTARHIDPDNSSDVSFLDDSLEKLYSKETRMARFIEFVALWSILLALTGLLGLIIFISRDRIKEIGIRKVNGASAIEITSLLNRNVLIWLGIAFVIAIPVAWYAMFKWLESFAYRTTLSWWIFMLAGLMALVAALLTVSLQSWRAAARNPVEALRYE